MNVRKLATLAADLARANLAFLSSGAQRTRIREALKIEGFSHRIDAIVRAEAQRAPAAAQPYARLAETSLALAGIRAEADRPPALNVVVGEVRTQGVFAGVHTALTASALLADGLGVELRVVMLDPTSTDNSRRSAERFLRAEMALDDVTVVTRESIGAHTFGRDDYWLATHSKTAHAVQVACEAGVIARERVAYLIQDYEPGFSAWSTESVLAEATYRAGFTPIVNSMPLWNYLTEVAGLEIDRESVFSPSFELERLRAAAAQRTPAAKTRVLFYGRRSKHRNLFALGVSALKSAAMELGPDAANVEFFSAGEQHDDIDLGNEATLVSRGRMGWEDYFRFLSTVDVALSLQESPHPSHPPFDAAISGAYAVTNDFGGTRIALHPRIAAVPADTSALGAAVVSAVREARAVAGRDYLPVVDGLLGASLDSVVARVSAAMLRRR